MTQKYNEIYQESIKNREDFWKEISNDIFWYKKPTKILNSQNPPFYKWFEDGVTNTCYNALDLHVDQGKGDKIAIIYDSPITGAKKNITYNKLKEKVALFAGALKKQGVSKGDRVIILYAYDTRGSNSYACLWKNRCSPLSCIRGLCGKRTSKQD